MTPPTVTETSVHSSQAAMGENLTVQERLVVSPCQGRFRPGLQQQTRQGEYVLAGQQVGTILSSDSTEVPIRSPFAGWVMGYLVPEGSPVRASEPVLWLSP